MGSEQHEAETRRHFRDIFEVGIEFESRKFKVIAPPLNHRINLKAAQLKREAKMLSRRETGRAIAISKELSASEVVDRKPSMLNKLGFGIRKGHKSEDDEESRRAREKAADFDRVHQIVAADILYEFTERDRQLIWEHRDELVAWPEALNCFLRSVDWRDPEMRYVENCTFDLLTQQNSKFVLFDWLQFR